MAVIEEQLSRLRRRHYVRHATAANRWFDFTSGKVHDFAMRYGDDFCLIINGSHTRDDAYILPFKVARRAFTTAALDARGRWVGTIDGTQLVLGGPSHNTLRVADYHNAFQHLGL